MTIHSAKSVAIKFPLLHASSISFFLTSMPFIISLRTFIEINKLVETIELFIEHEISGVYNVGDDNLSYFKLAKK